MRQAAPCAVGGLGAALRALRGVELPVSGLRRGVGRAAAAPAAPAAEDAHFGRVFMCARKAQPLSLFCSLSGSRKRDFLQASSRRAL